LFERLIHGIADAASADQTLQRDPLWLITL